MIPIVKVSAVMLSSTNVSLNVCAFMRSKALAH